MEKREEEQKGAEGEMSNEEQRKGMLEEGSREERGMNTRVLLN